MSLFRSGKCGQWPGAIGPNWSWCDHLTIMSDCVSCSGHWLVGSKQTWGQLNDNQCKIVVLYSIIYILIILFSFLLLTHVQFFIVLHLNQILIILNIPLFCRPNSPFIVLHIWNYIDCSFLIF